MCPFRIGPWRQCWPAGHWCGSIRSATSRGGRIRRRWLPTLDTRCPSPSGSPAAPPCGLGDRRHGPGGRSQPPVWPFTCSTSRRPACMAATCESRSTATAATRSPSAPTPTVGSPETPSGCSGCSGSGAPLRDDVPAGYARPAGHAGHPPNRGDTAVTAWTGPDAERLYPGWRCPGTFDVSGGWYDAGDYGKYVTSGSIAVWQLLSTLVLLPTMPTAGSTGLAETVREECRWQLDWLLRMQVPDGAPLAGMAFHRVHGTEWSPVPGWAHEDPTERVLHRPSTPATLQLAAAAAHGARHFGGTDPAYARRLLAAAKTAYAAAARHPQLGAPDDHARFGGGPYGDDDPTDDRYWAAAELWLVTGDQTYLEDMRASPLHTADVFDLAGFDFDRVAGLARLDLALYGAHLPDHDHVRYGVADAADRLLALQAAQPWGQPYAPGEGWDWGSNGRILNNLVVLVVAHLLTGNREYGNGVATGMDYLLGRNGLGQSYVTGYGIDYSRHQRTRQFGHDLDPAFPPPPPGALAGGPNSRPHPDFTYDERLADLAPQVCYLDEPTSEVTNDICIRWNAPLVYVSSFLNLSR